MTARITFLGDTLLGSKAQETLDREGYPHALADVAPLFADSDLVVVNHEGPVTATAPPAAKEYGARRPAWRRADPASLDALRDVGVRLVSLGNNHLLDHGPDGLTDTLTALDAAGIQHCGAGPDQATAQRAVTVDVHGERIRFVSGMAARRRYLDAGYYADHARPGPALLDPQQVADHAGDGLLVVLAHWGPGYGPVDDRQHRLAAQLRTAGAGLVIGTHPHSPQTIDTTTAAPVLFSLGNGAYGSMGRFARHAAPALGLVATVEISDQQVTAIELRTILTDNRVVRFRPRPTFDQDARAVLRSLLHPEFRGWQDLPDGMRWTRCC